MYQFTEFNCGNLVIIYFTNSSRHIKMTLYRKTEIIKVLTILTLPIIVRFLHLQKRKFCLISTSIFFFFSVIYFVEIQPSSQEKCILRSFTKFNLNLYVSYFGTLSETRIQTVPLHVSLTFHD